MKAANDFDIVICGGGMVGECQEREHSAMFKACGGMAGHHCAAKDQNAARGADEFLPPDASECSYADQSSSSDDECAGHAEAGASHLGPR